MSVLFLYFSQSWLVCLVVTECYLAQHCQDLKLVQRTRVQLKFVVLFVASGREAEQVLETSLACSTQVFVHLHVSLAVLGFEGHWFDTGQVQYSLKFYLLFCDDDRTDAFLVFRDISEYRFRKLYCDLAALLSKDEDEERSTLFFTFFHLYLHYSVDRICSTDDSDDDSLKKLFDDQKMSKMQGYGLSA
jgi:hypothetical protein